VRRGLESELLKFLAYGLKSWSKDLKWTKSKELILSVSEGLSALMVRLKKRLKCPL
jgi:hypothetical protein